MSNEVLIQDRPTQTIATWRTATTYDQVFTHIPEGFGRVFAHLGAAGIDPVGAPFAVFYQAPDADTEGDIAMAVPIAAPFTVESGDIDITIVELPAGPTALIVHQGSYASLGDSYAALAEWIAENGRQIVGPARETYMNSPADTAEADLLTEVLFPINAEETVVA